MFRCGLLAIGFLTFLATQGGRSPHVRVASGLSRPLYANRTSAILTVSLSWNNDGHD